MNFVRTKGEAIPMSRKLSPKAKQRKAKYDADYTKRANYLSQSNYLKNKVRKITLYVKLDTDADVNDRLNDVDNKSEYIKSLIRADIANQ